MKTNRRKVFTWNTLSSGKTLEFEASKSEKPYEVGEIIDLWCGFENDGLGDKIVYGQAEVISLPIRGLTYVAVVL